MTPDTDNAPEMHPLEPDADPAMADEAMLEETMTAAELEPDPAFEEPALAELAAADSAAADAVEAGDESLPESVSDPDDDAQLRGWLSSDELAGIVTEVDPTGLEYHPLSELLPLMSAAEFARLKESLELDGQQVPAIVFEGRVLDGRNRCQACVELGLLLRVQTFSGTEDQALMYVIAANQHRRELSKSLRAVVAVDLLPHISKDVNRKRIEKLKQSLAARREGECLSQMTNTRSDSGAAVSARAVAADIMGVSDGYVGYAQQLQRDAPELFERIRNGQLTVTRAWRMLTQEGDTELARKRTLARQCLNRIFTTVGENGSLLDELLHVLDQFADGLPET